MALTSLVKGDDWTFTGTILQPNGSPQDITGGKAWVTFKSNISNPDTSADFQVKMDPIPASDANGTNAASGIVVLVAAWDGAASNPPDSTLVTTGNYSYDFQYVHTDGSVTTIELGSVTIVAEVTEANT
jgi:hypothetical protein